MSFLNRYKKSDITSPVQSGGQAAFTSVNTPQSAPQQGPTSSGRFVNLQNYLTANSNSDLGQNLTNKILDQSSSVKNKVNEEQKSFNTQAQDSLTQARSGNTTISGITPTTTAKDLEKISTDTTAIAARDAEYKGPSSLDEQGAIKNQVEGFTDLANQTKTEKGRFNLLGNMFAKQGYSQGQKNLDNLILQGDTTSKNALVGTQRAANDLQNTYNQNLSDSKKQALQLTEEAQNIRKNVSDVLNKTVQGVGSSIDLAYDKALGEKSSLEDAFKAGKLIDTPELYEANKFGNMYSNNYFGVDPSKYLAIADPTKAGVASEEQIRQLNALKSLAGETLSGKAKGYVTDLSGTTDFGKYASNRFQGLDSFKQAVSDAGAIAKNEMNAAQDKVTFEQNKNNEANSLLERFNNLGIRNPAYYSEDKQKMLELGRDILNLSNKTGSNAANYLPTAFYTTSGDKMSITDLKDLENAINMLRNESSTALNINNKALQNIYDKYGTTPTGGTSLPKNKGVN